MTASLYIEGQWVVPRKIPNPNKRARTRTIDAWTLHTDGCHTLARADLVGVRPAPVRPYQHTMPCTYCRPNDRHGFLRHDNPDGTTTWTCRGCDITVTGNSPTGANSTMWLKHGQAEWAAELADWKARGLPLDIVRVRRPGGNGGRWKLHEATCSYVRRAVGVRPVPADLDLSTLDVCTICKPVLRRPAARAS